MKSNDGSTCYYVSEGVTNYGISSEEIEGIELDGDIIIQSESEISPDLIKIDR